MFWKGNWWGFASWCIWRKKIKKLLNIAKSFNINLLDTAPSYGNSEEKLGNIIHKERYNWIISTKAGEIFNKEISKYNYNETFLIKSLKNSLYKLKTDYIDIFLIHANGNDKNIIANNKIFFFLNNLKKQGLIRSYGISTKTIIGGLLTIKYADLAMITFNKIYKKEDKIINYAYLKKKGILIKKPFASGYLTKYNSKNIIQDNMNFLFAKKGITSIIIGSINEKHIKTNIKAGINAINYHTKKNNNEK